MIAEHSQIEKLYRHIKHHGIVPGATMVRDLTRIPLTDAYSLIIAVDSDGGIGSLEGDTIKCDPYQLGRFAMRVPLLELLSCGAVPIAAFDMLTIPMKGAGEKIVRGVRDELKKTGLSDDFPLSGSTEDNVPTIMTGIGTTIVGLVHHSEFRPGSSKQDDVVLCIGIPKSAPEDVVLLDDPDIVNQQDIIDILKIEDVHEILPVGSKGVDFEAREMANTASLEFFPEEKLQINLKKSGGPSTCVIVSCISSIINDVQNKLNVPVNVIGKFR